MKILKTIVAGFTFTASLGIMQVAQAVQENYHGTECMTANLAQGQLFSWNKDGITNNSAVSLFVICPMTYDRDNVNSLVSPRGDVDISVFFGPLVPNNTSFTCNIRFFNAQASGATGSDSHTTITNLAFSAGGQNFFGTGDNDNVSSSTFNINNDNEGSAHLLCLVPRGSTLRYYNFDIFE